MTGPAWVSPSVGGAALARLKQLDEAVARDLPDVTSLLASRGGQLIFERYFHGTPDEPRELQSVSKSVLALLVGRALHLGRLTSLDQPALALLGREEVPEDARWSAVTLRHLMTMTAGLPSELTDPAYDDAWLASADPVAFVLARPLLEAPGGTFRYSNAGAHLLGAVLASAVGQPLAAFAQGELWTPLGVQGARWAEDPQGRPYASGGLSLPSRELLKTGHLLLQDGQWNGRSLVPPGWVQEMTRPHVKGYAWMEGIPDYGLLWWAAREEETEGWYATGYGGQYLAVFPASGVVVVATGRPCDHPPHRQIVTRMHRALAG
ncbi:serine hydrolase domain-containing protein [Deinococcus navajonensis]|uniref:Serine hydrolase domain-containing protein n=1 Tax=Deinococcus navajonensis TaxID=309884 RepID=A0ABV8XQW9_9DEIO